MVEKEWTPASLLDVFGDRIARATLVVANQQPRSVEDIANTLGVSKQTIYRRVDELVDSDLLKEHQRFGPDGNQRVEYETIMDEVTLTVDDDGYTVDVQVRQDLSEDFGDMWSDLEDTNRPAETAKEADAHRRDPA